MSNPNDAVLPGGLYINAQGFLVDANGRPLSSDAMKRIPLEYARQNLIGENSPLNASTMVKLIEALPELEGGEDSEDEPAPASKKTAAAKKKATAKATPEAAKEAA